MAYTLVQIDKEGQKEALMSLWARNFGSIPEGRYHWQYENNPAGPPICFFLRNESENKIVGSFSLFPRTLFVDGKEISGFICGDFTVDQKHRTLGPAVMLLKAAMQKCESNAPCILFGIPNRNSGPVMRRTGFQVLNDVYELTQVLRTYPYILKRINSSAIASIAAFFLDPFLRLRPANFFAPNQKGYIVDIDSQPACETSRLQPLPHNEYSLIGERSSDFLQWRFMAAPYAKYQAFSLGHKQRKNLKCYIIFSMKGKRTHIADFFVRDQRKFGSLFAAFTSYQRSLGTESISFSFAGNFSVVERLQQLGYSLRSREQKMLIYTSGKNALINSLKRGCWYLTSADNDV